MIQFSGEVTVGDPAPPSNEYETIRIDGRDLLNSMLSNPFKGTAYVRTSFGVSAEGPWVTAFGRGDTPYQVARRPALVVGSIDIGALLLERDGQHVTVTISDREEEMLKPVPEDLYMLIAADYINKREWIGRYSTVRGDKCEKAVRHWTSGTIDQCSHARKFWVAGREFCSQHTRNLKATFAHMGIIRVDDVYDWNNISGLVEMI